MLSIECQVIMYTERSRVLVSRAGLRTDAARLRLRCGYAAVEAHHTHTHTLGHGKRIVTGLARQGFMRCHPQLRRCCRL